MWGRQPACPYGRQRAFHAARQAAPQIICAFRNTDYSLDPQDRNGRNTALPVNLRSLNPPQRVAVETTNGPLLVLSGAGTGKTRVITYRIAHLIEKGVSPASILAVTFTKKAAREMRDRVKQLVPRGGTRDMVISTFHSFCVRVLREEIEGLGYKRNFTICDPNDQLSTVRAALKEVVMPGQTFDPKLVLFKVGRAKNDMLSAKQLENRAADDLDLVAARAYKRYQEALKAQNTLDFDDLLMLSVKLFQKDKGVAKKFQQRFQYILVDEYQDTNQTQYQLLRSLVGKERNICVVGDDDQSIYGWRGAQVGNILNFERDFRGAKVVRLEQNYRSTDIILQAANAVVANNAQRKEKRLWTENGKGQFIDCIEAADERDEADEVVRRIAQIVIKKQGSYGDCCILYRTNAQSRSYEEKLRLRRIPYTVVGGMKYYDRKEIRDVLAYFKCVVNSDDEASLRRIINTPARGISKPTVQALSDFSIVHKMTLYEALARAEENEAINAKAQEACKAFYETMERYREAFAPGCLSDPAREFLEEIQYEDELIRQYDNATEAMNRIDNVREIVSALAEYEKASVANTLQSYLDNVATREENDDTDVEDQNGAKLMSLHSAKGLEFPYVFLVGMEEGLLPHRKSETDDEDSIDEERRLCYVGITRAQKHLTMTYTAERVKYGRSTQPVPSRFIEEIPQQLLNRCQQDRDTPAEADSQKDYLAAIREMLARGDDVDAAEPGAGKSPAAPERVGPPRRKPVRARKPSRPAPPPPKAKAPPAKRSLLKGIQQTKSKRKKAK